MGSSPFPGTSKGIACGVMRYFQAPGATGWCAETNRKRIMQIATYQDTNQRGLRNGARSVQFQACTAEAAAAAGQKKP